MLIKTEGSTNPAQRTYVRWTLGTMAIYAAINIAAMLGAFDAIDGTRLAWSLAIAVATCIAAQIFAVMRLLRDSDEYMRALNAKQFIFAAGGAMALFSAWGFGESYAAAPHAPGWLIYPLFWAVFGLIQPFMKSSNW